VALRARFTGHSGSTPPPSWPRWRGPSPLRAESESHAESWLRSLLPLPGAVFLRHAPEERDLRAVWTYQSSRKRTYQNFWNPRCGLSGPDRHVGEYQYTK